MDVAAVMTEIADRMRAVVGERTYAYPPDDVQTPAAVLVAPEQIRFDATYGRGSDEIDLPLLLLVSRVDDRSAWAELAAYCNGSGATSVKQVLESGTYTAFGTVHVPEVGFDVVKWAGIDYLAALFPLNILGKGAL